MKNDGIRWLDFAYWESQIIQNGDHYYTFRIEDKSKMLAHCYYVKRHWWSVYYKLVNRIISNEPAFTYMWECLIWLNLMSRWILFLSAREVKQRVMIVVYIRNGYYLIGDLEKDYRLSEIYWIWSWLWLLCSLTIYWWVGRTIIIGWMGILPDVLIRINNQEI